MDLSFLKWPVIILVVAGGAWLVTDGGVNYMINQFKQSTPGEDESRDRVDEAGLSRVAGFLLLTFRYQKADEVLTYLTQNYVPANGAEHYWHNLYRLAKCKEKQGNYSMAVSIMQELAHRDAHTMDDRVARPEVLRLRAEKLMETHEIGEVGQF
jgi:hypothetical protein